MTEQRADLPRVAKAGLARRQLRAIFLSDIHLGTIGCKADRVLDFLNRNEAPVIYLVGDILDTWRPLGGNYRDSHHQVLKHLSDRVNEGVRVIFLPGNHDDFFRNHLGSSLFGFEIMSDAEYVTQSGERLLVIHGDCCDVFSDRLAMLSKAGSWLETGIRRLGNGINKSREWLGRGGWDGLERLLARVNGFIRRSDRFEARLLNLARERGFDGIICGHFHKPNLYRENGLIYANCGDWIENCSALIEPEGGPLTLIRCQPVPDGLSHVGEHAGESDARAALT
ncbi:MAG: UDP-2,3-diacylglucosamine diphosphatase [Paracoccus sp. (in: a-proteobacteria)]|uniref:UDP-2,3-diacylglucosamine diphosphatase n=1 Tax=Paracoccus sp. TaxID=267 RepID=UPI0026DEE2CE|nr:UDP-2,3-diacylglucosamine diphosphatase [Paracoccus sp. (in: a-proteobacteria)]MDO5620115.1 UDP-2,3-diacylglucosamine diphosphatase [Paracoccus sp. (in: a-proteobacteria)]